MRRHMVLATRLAGRILMLFLLLSGAGIGAIALIERRPQGGLTEDAAAEVARRVPPPVASPVASPPGAARRDATGEPPPDLVALRVGLLSAGTRIDALRSALEELRTEIAALATRPGQAAEVAGLRREVSDLAALRREVADLGALPGQVAALNETLRVEVRALREEIAGRHEPTAAEAPATPPRPLLARALLDAGAAAAPPATQAGVTIHRRAGSVAARRAADQVAEEVRRAGLAVAAVRDEPEVPPERLIRGDAPEATRLATRFRERWGHPWQLSEARQPGLEVWLPHR